MGVLAPHDRAFSHEFLCLLTSENTENLLIYREEKCDGFSRVSNVTSGDARWQMPREVHENRLANASQFSTPFRRSCRAWPSSLVVINTRSVQKRTVLRPVTRPMSDDTKDASCLTHAQQHTHGVAASAKPSVAARSRVHETAPVVLISAGWSSSASELILETSG